MRSDEYTSSEVYILANHMAARTRILIWWGLPAQVSAPKLRT
jgi:hypothetical protein